MLTVSSFGLAFRLILRTRLTLNRLTLFRKPWLYGGRASHPPYRYLYLHLLFHLLHTNSRLCFADNGMLPYRLNPMIKSRGFGGMFHTRLLSTRRPSTSELLRTL